MTLDDLIKGAELLKKQHGGHLTVGVSVGSQVTLHVGLMTPPVTMTTLEGVKDVILLLVVEKNED